jgi:hypothetical protein
MVRRRSSSIVAIEQALSRYCRAIDRRDWELLRHCYHAGAIDEHGPYNGDVDGFIDWLRVEVVKYDMTMHFLGNVLVEFSGSRTANVESYCIAYHRSSESHDGQSLDRTIGLRYVDRFTRIRGEWRIAHRQCIYDFGRMDPVIDAERALNPRYPRGSPGRDDASSAAMAGRGERWRTWATRERFGERE